MSRRKQAESAQTANVFQFTLAGLILFSLALVVGASLGGFKLATRSHPKLEETFAKDPNDPSCSVRVGPWGQLMTRNISLEQPVEYITEEATTQMPETWTFNGMNLEAVKVLLAKAGLTAPEINTALTTGTVRKEQSGTVLVPSTNFIFSLTAETRAKLYIALNGKGVNLYADYPYVFPGNSLDAIYASSRLHPDDVATLKKLIYANGNVWQLSDYPALLCQVPTLERRVALARVLSRQTAVLGRILIKPDTDVDKIADYWCKVPGVRVTDIRPMLESLKRLPQGGDVSLLFFLPKFARDRMYSFPLPPQAGEPIMDCHWSSLNFSNETPDNRFNDPKYTTDYILKNYYPIAAPNQYGDILLLLDDQQDIKHSAVYLADDLVFTKNGSNFRQPWMIMHIPDLLATYPATPAMKVVYMRRKTQ